MIPPATRSSMVRSVEQGLLGYLEISQEATVTLSRDTLRLWLTELEQSELLSADAAQEVCPTWMKIILLLGAFALGIVTGRMAC